MAKQYHFLRVPDGAILRLASELMRGDHEASSTFQAADGLRLDLNDGDALTKEWAKTFGSKSYLITTGTVSVPSADFILTYYRGQKYQYNPQYNFRWEPTDATFTDGIEINGPTASKRGLTVLDRLNQFLSLAPPVELTKPGAAALEQSSVILNRITEAAATLLEHTGERQQALDDARTALEAEIADKLAKERGVIEAEQAANLAGLATKTKELDDRASLLDDRENTHARRELSKSMSKIAEQSLESDLLAKSRESYQQNRIIASIFALILLMLAAVQSYWTAITTPANSNLIIFGEVRTIGLGAGAAALIWYALRLGSTRFSQISRWENDLNRFRLDVERASFLVEGDLEARKHGDAGLPEVLLERFSQGLFSSGPGDQGREADDIGSTLGHLLSRAASVKVGTDGVSVEIDKSGIRKARKDIASDSQEA